MIYVPTVELTKGMVLSKNIYNTNGNNILSKGETLTISRIQKLRSFKIQGVYVTSDVLDEINKDRLQEKIKGKTLRVIKAIFEEIELNKQIEKNKLEKIIKIVNETFDNLLKNSDLLININNIKAFDEYTYFHSVNVMVISLVTGIGLCLDKKDLLSLGLAAILHDIGKILIPLSILNKKECLSINEFSIIQQHSKYGYEIVNKINNLSEDVKKGILEHHERFDGTGYPCGKKGEEIGLFGRIISIADVYDAITSDRIYRKGIVASEALEFITDNSGVLFDDEIVETFLKQKK